MKREEKKKETKEKGKGKEKKERKKEAISNTKDPSRPTCNRFSPVILALDNQTVQHKVISLKDKAVTW